MKTRDAFVEQRKPAWDRLDALLAQRSSRNTGAQISEIASIYREICEDRMFARARSYGLDLVAYLDALAARAHAFLYGASNYRSTDLVRILLIEFPQTLRANLRFFLFASLLFLVPLLLGLFFTLHKPTFAEAILPIEALESMAENYSKGFADGRDSGVDARMAGFYVNNNIGIAFRCFATGILFGMGSIFFLVYNGLIIGTTLGYVSVAGHARNILTFVSGHSAFELIAILIAGTGGLRLGYALIAPGQLTRGAALRNAARPAVTLAMGAAGMLLIAAFIEGFWSPSSVSDPVKWLVGGANSLLVAAFLGFAGKSQRAPERLS